MHLSYLEFRGRIKKFERRLIFKPGLKYGWIHLKLYSIFQDLSRRSIKTGFLRIWDAAQIHEILLNKMSCFLLYL